MRYNRKKETGKYASRDLTRSWSILVACIPQHISSKSKDQEGKKLRYEPKTMSKMLNVSLFLIIIRFSDLRVLIQAALFAVETPRNLLPHPCYPYKLMPGVLSPAPGSRARRI